MKAKWNLCSVVLALSIITKISLLGQSPPTEATANGQFDITGCTFSPTSDHPYFPLEPGYKLVLAGDDEEGAELVVEWEVLEETRTFTWVQEGVSVEIETAIVRETETEDGELVEISHNFFAQCEETGSVFYFGETVDDFEDGVLVGHSGAWLAFEGGNRPGVIMPGEFVLGDRYQQEVALGIAEDSAVNVAEGLTVETPAGTFEDVIHIEEIDPLEPDSPPSSKFYAPEVGLIIDDVIFLTEGGDGQSQYDPADCTFSPVGNNPYFPLLPGHRLVLRGEEEGALFEVIWEVLAETHSITLELDGEEQTIETAIVRETETEDGELVEISWNYYAHCEETGSVFYFGEDVDDFEDGQLVGHSGAWLAGRDGAVPGVIMPGEFIAGDTYFQEVAPGIAEDLARNVSDDETEVTPLGVLRDVIVIEESDPLEPDAPPSLKRYAPGIGLIFDDFVEVVEAMPGPRLNIVAGVLMSWPVVEGDFLLESATDIAGPWEAMTVPIAEFDDQFIASVPNVSPQHMFRLRQFRVVTADPEETPIVINEFMASNSQTLEDPSGGFDDWIELRNTTTQSIDVSGMYLSDDPQNLTRWQIPEGTMIGGGEYLIIWADGDEEADIGLHASFRLAAGGETLLLVGPEGNLDALIDSVSYEAVEADQSIGRLGEDPSEFALVPPSPGQANP